MNLMNLFRRWFGAEKTLPAVPAQAVSQPASVDRERSASVALAPRKRSRCMIAGCSARRMYRGVCTVHYNQARSAIKRGDMTEQQAIDAKLILPCSIRSKRKAQWEPVHVKSEPVKVEPVNANCIWTGCGRVEHHRGACWSHYHQVRDSILKGQFTEREAVEAGMVKPGCGRRIGYSQPGRRKLSP